MSSMHNAADRLKNWLRSPSTVTVGVQYWWDVTLLRMLCRMAEIMAELPS